MLMMFGEHVFTCVDEVDEQLFGVVSFSEDEVPQDSCVCILIVSGESACLYEFLYMVECLLCFVCDQMAVVDIYDILVRSCLVKSCDSFAITVGSETKLNLVSIVVWRWGREYW